MKLVVFLNLFDRRYYLSKKSIIHHSGHPKAPIEDKLNSSKDILFQDMKWVTSMLEMGYSGSTAAMILDRTHGSGSFHSNTVINLSQKMLKLKELAQNIDSSWSCAEKLMHFLQE